MLLAVNIAIEAGMPLKKKEKKDGSKFRQGVWVGCANGLAFHPRYFPAFGAVYQG